MNMRVPVWWAAAATVALLLTSCGGSGAAPTPEEIAGSLLTAGDLGEGWQVEYSGPVTDEMRADPGGVEMCPEAESIVAPIGEGRQSSGDWNADWQAALADLDWQVAIFTLPVEREDAQPVSFVEGLVTGDPEHIESIYTALSEGYRLCLALPAEPESGDMPVHEAAELALPDVGSERFGWILSMGDAANRWDMRWVLVRDGAVLMNISENEVLSGENVLTNEEIADMVEAAAAKLP